MIVLKKLLLIVIIIGVTFKAHALLYILPYPPKMATTFVLSYYYINFLTL